MTQLSIFSNSTAIEDYKKHLGFEYGNNQRLIDSMIKGIEMYSATGVKTPKVMDRIKKYSDMLEIAKSKILA
jgi:hypothetical protein